MRYIKYFEFFVATEKPTVELNLSNNYDSIELVPVEQLIKFKEYDRIGEDRFPESSDKIKTIKRSFIENGIKDVLIIDYSQPDKSVLLIEGNHRLIVAMLLGLRYLPARVVRRNSSFDQRDSLKSMRVTGIEPNRHNYVPADLKPSQVGIKGCKPITHSLY